jgi:ribosomal protein S18 acetylase RimI-like enzyme
MQRLCDLDYESNTALLVCAGPEQEDIVAMARYDAEPETRFADMHVVVTDAWQRKGVGSLLLRHMREIAAARGLVGFSAEVLVENEPMLRLFREGGLELEIEPRGHVLFVKARFAGDGPDPTPSVPAAP